MTNPDRFACSPLGSLPNPPPESSDGFDVRCIGRDAGKRFGSRNARGLRVPPGVVGSPGASGGGRGGTPGAAPSSISMGGGRGRALKGTAFAAGDVADTGCAVTAATGALEVALGGAPPSADDSGTPQRTGGENSKAARF